MSPPVPKKGFIWGLGACLALWSLELTQGHRMSPRVQVSTHRFECQPTTCLLGGLGKPIDLLRLQLLNLYQEKVALTWGCLH